MAAKIAFRTDASIEIGTGHVMRCAGLAAELRARGAEIAFVCRELPETSETSLSDQGFMVLRIASCSPVDSLTDAEQTKMALHAFGSPDWLVVDHYNLDASWERQLRPVVRSIMVIDDLANRLHDCDILLDQNNYTDPEVRYRGLVGKSCQLMLGPRYALLREQFAAARALTNDRSGTVRRVLIVLGGTDPGRRTAMAIEAFLAAGLDHVAADVVVGAANPHWEELVRAYGCRPDISLHRDVKNMAMLMARADLYLGAGGSITWERAVLGLPGITLAVAENQRELCRDLERLGGGVHLDFADDPASITSTLRFLVSHPPLLRSFGQKLASLSDGRGTGRIARRMLPPAVHIRRAVAIDCDNIYLWRNAPETRRYSGEAAPISMTSHRAWFGEVLSDPGRILLIGEQTTADGETESVGVLRYDLAGNSAIISAYLVPGRSGEGLGTALITAGDEWLRVHHPGISQIDARIRADNAGSIGAFSASGYRYGLSLFSKTLDRVSSAP